MTNTDLISHDRSYMMEHRIGKIHAKMPTVNLGYKSRWTTLINVLL